MGIKVSEAIELLKEVLETSGDHELKIADGRYYEECRELYLDFQENRTNQFVVLSRHILGWDRNKANHYYLGHKQGGHPNNKMATRRKKFIRNHGEG